MNTNENRTPPPVISTKTLTDGDNPLADSTSPDNPTATSADVAQTGRQPYRRMRLTIDGRRLRELVRAGYFWLKQQEEVVNNLNVYPVPDGDTGTNMMHTMRAAWEAVVNLDEPHIGRLAKAVSSGALRGSRGNSGIILSQLWRGFARSLDGKEVMDAHDMAAAFREASKTAYSGVSTPVEGTILTVSRETADAVEYGAKDTFDMRRLMTIASEAAFDSVQRTPNLLKILKEAGVVDSGGYGLYVILAGMVRHLNGQPVDEDVAVTRTASATSAEHGLPQQAGGWGYDVQYLIYAPKGQALDVQAVRRDIEAMGDCPLVMGDVDVVKVHVHVPDPGVPISYGAKLGSLRDVVVEDMQAQSEEFGDDKAHASGQKAASSEPLAEVDVAFVTVASGEGIANTFKDIGARVVIAGGQTMNPSVDDFLIAIKQAHAKHTVLLPNNGNIVMTAQQAAQLSELPATVVPTKTIPQGIAAAIAFNFGGDVDSNISAMNAASQRVITGEVTLSTRNVTLNGVTVRDGQTIGLINDKLAVGGESPLETLLATLEKAGAASHELITLYYGNNVTQAEAESVTARVRAAYPDQQVDLYMGGQPHYYYIAGIE